MRIVSGHDDNSAVTLCQQTCLALDAVRSVSAFRLKQKILSSEDTEITDEKAKGIVAYQVLCAIVVKCVDLISTEFDTVP